MIFRQKYVWGALKKENYLIRRIMDNSYTNRCFTKMTA